MLLSHPLRESSEVALRTSAPAPLLGISLSLLTSFSSPTSRRCAYSCYDTSGGSPPPSLRRWRWCAKRGVATRDFFRRGLQRKTDPLKVLRVFMERLTGALCYAAKWLKSS
jgi:hypothetical protein